MPDARDEDEGLFDREARHREDLLTSFEEEWFAGRPPDLPAFVRKHLPPWLPRREPTVAELIRVDQEFRIKAGEPSRVEDYLTALDFAPERDLLLDLVLGEFTLRSRFGVPPTAQEYGTRFPQLAEELRGRLGSWKEATSIEAFAPPGETVLHVVSGPHRGLTVRLEPGRPLLVGRADSADVRLGGDESLSRFHVRLELADGQVRFRDMNSRNGTRLNGRPIGEGELLPGDALRCGQSEIRFALPSEGTIELGPAARAVYANAEEERLAAVAVPGYELVESLGRGALGETFAAIRLATDEEVAIKIVDLPEAAAKTVSVICETTALQRIAEPVLLLPSDVGLAGGRPYVVTPRHRPVPFAKLTAGDSSPDRLAAAARVVDRLLAALGPLHEAGLVHGDIKPSNVLLERTRQGLRIKLADFGLARAFGRPGAGTEPSDDLLALGRLLHRFALGGSEPKDRQRLPEAAERVLLRAVDPEPDQRYRSWAEFARDLAELRA